MKDKLQRTCVGCNKKKNKYDLLRITKNKEKSIEIDTKYKMQGRGTYICKDLNCLEMAIKKKKLEKSFLGKIDPELYRTIKDVICDK